MINDVALWFSRNSKGEIVTIDEIKNYHEDSYVCPLCNSEVIPKAIKFDAKVTKHFAHIDKSKCTPESMIHWWFKNKFLKCGDEFIVNTDKEKAYVCKDVMIEQSYKTTYGEYKPDITIVTQSDETIYFEMNYTSKKNVKEYLDKWLELGNSVVEVNIKTLLQANYGKNKYKFNALFYEGKCFNIKKSDMYYNIIGVYKENKVKTFNDLSSKTEIEKLDWFWDEVQKYKMNQTTEGELYICFNEAVNFNFTLIKNILLKSNCTDIFYNCLNYRRRYFMDVISNCLSQYNFGTPVSAKLNFNNLCLFDISINIEKNDDDVVNQIHNIIKKKLQEIKHDKELDAARNNTKFTDVINKLNNEYQQIDPNYKLYDRFGYGAYVTFQYAYLSTLVDISLDSEIIFSKDEKEIEKYLRNPIDSYFANLVPFSNEKDLENIVLSLNSNFKKVSYTHSYEYKVRKHYYKTKHETHGFQISLKKYNPEYIVLKLNEINYTKYNMELPIGNAYFIYKNKLYTNRYENCNKGTIPNESTLLLNDCQDTIELRKILMSEFSSTIRNIKFKED